MDIPEIPSSEIDQTPDVEVLASAKFFKCNSCGAKMEFVPGSSSQKCPYCSHENPIAQSEEDIQELDYHAMLAEKSEEEESIEQLTVKCEQCAAQFSTEPNITSQDCPFCGTTIVATAKSSKHLKPKSVLPFKVTRKEGWEHFHQWVKKLWFAPNQLKKRIGSQDKLKGIYVPYWTYDSDTTSFYSGMRGIHYYVTETYTETVDGKSQTRTRQVRKTRWYPASGTVWNAFDDVLVLASESIPRGYTRKLEPWDLPNLTAYKDEYLSGFQSESYQINLEEGFDIAKTRMEDPIRSSIRRDIGGDEQQIHTVKTQYDNITFKHILLPIWISSYRYKNKVYRFLINGRTGEVQGERPWSAWKITFAVTLAVLVVGGIIYGFNVMDS